MSPKLPLLAAMLLISAPGAAQQGSNDIIVTARPKPPIEVVRKRLRAITRRTGEQIARFNEPVCAGVIGLPQPYAARVVTRMMTVAKNAGAALAGPRCRPNLTLVIVDDGRLLLTELKRQKPALFNALPAREVERALTEPGPARVITLTQLLSRDGRAQSLDYTNGNTGMAGGAPVLQVESASIVNMATRQDITGSLVLIDTAAALGKGLDQLADYAALRALAKTNVSAHEDDDTILSLFSGQGTPPRGLTAFDAAFLKALYHGPATMKYGTKISSMAREIMGK